jgi:hypothetical protein
MDVMLYLDESGSMVGEPATFASAAAHTLVRRLRADDRLGIVGVGAATQTARKLRPVGERVSAHAAIDRLAPGGEASGEWLAVRGSGVRAPSAQRGALRSLTAAHFKGGSSGAGVASLALYVTDGVGPVALPPGPGAASTDRAAGAHRTATPTLVFVVGRRASPEALDALASTPGVELRFVREPRDLPRALERAVFAYRLAAARDLELSIAPAPGVRVARVYGAEVSPDGEQRVRVSALGPGEAKVVLAELDVGPGAAFEPTRLAEVTVVHRDDASARVAHAGVTVTTLRATSRAQAFASRDRSVLRSALAIRTGDAVARAGRALAEGDAPEARRRLAEQEELLLLSASTLHDPALYEDARALAAYARVLRWVAPSLDGPARRRVAMSMRIDGDGRMR